MAQPVEVGDKDFEERVLKSALPVLVDFWAPWCGPCRMVAPIVAELSGEYDGRMSFTKLNVDDNPQVSARYGIRSIPTLIIFKDGQPFRQVVGYQPKLQLKKHLEAALAQG
ncbi:MAG: thioredoxin [Chloroflexi bacterium]|nr:thioredoxin [Chloroflexota bacterium]